jgi:hypothetical protein
MTGLPWPSIQSCHMIDLLAIGSRFFCCLPKRRRRSAVRAAANQSRPSPSPSFPGLTLPFPLASPLSWLHVAGPTSKACAGCTTTWFPSGARRSPKLAHCPRTPAIERLAPPLQQRGRLLGPCRACCGCGAGCLPTALLLPSSNIARSPTQQDPVRSCRLPC